MPGHDVVVVGASAGGMEALSQLAAGLPGDLPAAVFVVWHLSPCALGVLPDVLTRAGPLPATNAVDGEPVLPAHVYVAPPDQHLLLEPGRVRLSHGPRENRFRRAVDPLFRSAALSYGPRVVGVVLTGALDDGAAGLWAVKQCGGTAVVQAPLEALFPSMPRSAMAHVKVDHCLPLAEIPPLLARLAREPAPEGRGGPPPRVLEMEARIAMEDRAIESGVEELGELSPFTCPECHGTLLRLKDDGPLRFRCHTGHAYTASALLSELTESVEGTLWSAVRAVEESVLLMRHVAGHLREAGDGLAADAFLRKAEEARQRAEVVRQAVMRHENLSEEKLSGGGGGQ